MNDKGSNSKGSLLAIFLTVFIDLLGFGMVLPLLPIYAEQFTVDEHGWQLGMLMASFSLMQFFFAPLWGRWSDRVGRRPVILIGLFGSVIFYTLFGFATVWKSLFWLFVARIGAGICGATIPTAQAYIADTTTREDRPRGMALIGMAFGLGFTLGPLLGYLAVPSGTGDPGPGPGYAAAGLSTFALLLALFRLPESRIWSMPTESNAHPQNSKYWQVLGIPSIGLLLGTLFLCVFSFANFETTLSILIKGNAPFHFTFRQVCLSYAFIGLVLAFVQGGIVRRIAGRTSEAAMATGGAIAQIVGFLAIRWASQTGSIGGLFAALAVVVAGFAFLMPSLNSLLSRRTDSERQGTVLGMGQSASSLARILGSGLGIPLFRLRVDAPYLVAAVLMTVSVGMILLAVRMGGDFKEGSRDKLTGHASS